METVFRHVGDLDQKDRSALERVIGHTLGEMQQVIIQVTNNPPEPKANGEAPSGPLPDWCNVYEGLTDRQVEELSRSIVRLPDSRAS